MLAPAPVEDSLARLRATAFSFETFPEIEPWGEPESHSLALLRAWDPHGYFRDDQVTP
jgi:hypothetical protein